MSSPYEKSKLDQTRDRIGMKEAGMKSMAKWEKSMADRKEDVMNDYASYRHQREPVRERIYVNPDGPFFRNGKLNREPWNSFTKKDEAE